MKRWYGAVETLLRKTNKSNLQASLKENKGLEFWPKDRRFVETKSIPTSCRLQIRG